MLDIIKSSITSGMGSVERVIPIVNLLSFNYLNLLRDRIVKVETFDDLHIHELYLINLRLIDIKNAIDNRDYEIVTTYTFDELDKVISHINMILSSHGVKV